MNACFKRSLLRCLLLSASLFFFCGAFAQKTITGRVTDEDNQPLSNVTIIEKGTTNGSTTAADGSFRIAVKSGAKTLVLSMVGYEPMELDISSQTDVSARLQKTADALESVVVVGYGTQRRKDVTGAITTVTAESFNKGITPGVNSLIQGKVPGLVISRNGGDPNGAQSVLLRGPSTINGSTAPFYVIDGVPGADIATVNPDDIASIDVMRDATSTAIYGTRAANGVILVTTRRAKSGQSILSYSAYASVDKINKRLDLATGDELRAYLQSQGRSLSAVDDDKVNTDWQNVITRTGSSQNHSLSFGGGNQQSKFLFSLGYFDQKGVVKKSGFSRYNGRLNVEHSMFNNRLRFRGNVAATFRQASQINYNALYYATIYLPTVNIYNADGSFKENTSTQDYKNPLGLIEQIDDRNKYTALNSNGSLSWDILNGLTTTVSGTYEARYFRTSYYASKSSFDFNSVGGFARRSSVEGASKILETFLNYDKNIGTEHQLKLLAGYSWQKDANGDGLSLQTNNFLIDDLGYYGIGNSNPVGTTPFSYFASGLPTLSESTLISFYGRANYIFKDKYIVQGIVRRDGSSKFGVNNKWATFPAASFAWRINEEGFMKNSRLFNDLKLRAGYGVSGNATLNPYQSFIRFRNGSLAYVNGNWVSSYTLLQIANPDLQWEKTATTNLGLDFAILKGKLSGTVEVYKKKTTEMLYTYDLPSPPFPSNNITGNGGEMINKGVEFTLNYQNKFAKSLSWRSGFNASYNKNKIVTLNTSNQNLQALPVAFKQVGVIGGKGLTGLGAERLVPGYSLGTFYLYQYAGQDAQGQNLYFDSSNKNRVRQTALLPRDQRIITGANGLPTFTIGWANTVDYKSFSLNFSVRGVFGNRIFNGAAMDLDRLAQATKYNVSQAALNRGNTDAPTYSTLYLENGNYVRLDNATLSYRLPISRAYKSATVYVSGNNLLTITKFSGVDPEGKIDGIEPGLVGLGVFGSVRPVYFQTRSFTAGVNFNF